MGHDHNDSECKDKDRLLLEVGLKLACAIEGLTEYLKHNNHAVLIRMEQHLHTIMATQADIVADLKIANTQLRKLIADTAGQQAAVDALKAKIIELEALVAAGGTIGQELVDTVAETKALTQTVDDNVPELPALPPQP